MMGDVPYIVGRDHGSWIREILPLFAVDTPKAMLFVISDQSLVFATEKERLPSFSMVDESVMKLDACRWRFGP